MAIRSCRSTECLRRPWIHVPLRIVKSILVERFLMPCSPAALRSLLMICVSATAVAGCSTMGAKPSAGTSQPQQAAAVSPMAVDADIQRILTAGGIPANDPVVAALQSPPPTASAWGEQDAQVAAVAAPTEPADTVQVAAAAPSVSTPGVIGVEALPQTAIVSTPYVFPTNISSGSAAPSSQPLSTPNLAAAATSYPGQIPASMAAGILPMPDFSNVTTISGPEAVTPSAPAPVAAPTRPKVVPMPTPRPPNLYAATQPAAAAVVQPSAPLAAPVPAPSPSVKTVRRF